MHLGMAREHSHVAAPNTVRTTPAVNTKVLVIKRMARRWSGNDKTQAHGRYSSCRPQLSTL